MTDTANQKSLLTRLRGADRAASEYDPERHEESVRAILLLRRKFTAQTRQKLRRQAAAS